nr:isoform 2 of udp-glycosyltransferase 73b4 [Quercus suber]
MNTESDQLHVLFFPLMAHGHMLPTLDIARLFSARGVKTTIITTPKNAPLFTKTLDKIQNSSTKISLKIVHFPAKEVGLPEGFENLDLVTDLQVHRKFFAATSLLQQPLDDLLQELHPHGLVADMFFPWATDIASRRDQVDKFATGGSYTIGFRE